MSESVVRMEMPKSCYDCEIRDGKAYCPICGATLVGYKRSRHENCPVICSLPEGHGRLVDADAFEKDVSDALVYGLKEIPSEEGKQLFHVLMQEVLDNVKKRETIVPAEAPKEK